MISKLEDLSAMSLVVAFCCQSEIIDGIILKSLKSGNKVLTSEIFKLNEALQREFSEDVLQHLLFPIKEIVPNYLLPNIAIEIYEWINHHRFRYSLSPSFCIKFLKSSYFTHEGTLDKGKVARELVYDNSLDLSLRIAIALDYYLIEDFNVIWTYLTGKEKSNFIHGKFIKKYKLPASYWLIQSLSFGKILLLAIRNESTNISKNPTFYRFALHHGNEVAFKNSWMLLELPWREKALEKIVDIIYSKLYSFCLENTKCISDFAKYRPFIEILKFLIQNVNNKTLKKILLKQDIQLPVLTSLLIWPNQKLFIKMVVLVWENLHKFTILTLLHSIAYMSIIPQSRNTYNYKLLFKEIWHLAPLDYQKWFLENGFPMNLGNF